MSESTARFGEMPAFPPAGGDDLGGPAFVAPSSQSLPPYTRSLLRIQVPVVVTLAEKRQPLGRIIELSPGAILQFDKSCEEMLELFVGDRPIACGEAVKVGDKFGLRITSITPPDERFYPLGSADAPRH
jgi:flagellar motor switch/type III secretory pathway protein FliN